MTSMTFLKLEIRARLLLINGQEVTMNRQLLYYLKEAGDHLSHFFF